MQPKCCDWGAKRQPKMWTQLTTQHTELNFGLVASTSKINFDIMHMVISLFACLYLCISKPQKHGSHWWTKACDDHVVAAC